MQLAAIEACHTHSNVILLANTGSGKTLGFLMPILETLDNERSGTQALIITPSRELALQIESVFKKMQTGWKITCCYGGHLRETEENNLLESPTVIVGTPGRLGDHLRRANIKPEGIRTLVLDEYDKSFELGFQEEISFIIQSLPNIDKRILTSATEAAVIPAFVGMDNPTTLNFLTGIQSDALEILVLKAPERDKLDSLFKLICHLGSRPSIIFLNHRESVGRTSEYLTERGIVNEFYHGALDQRERDSALCKFKNGTAQFLVTTDLAARGLDIPHIRYIIHYHLPESEDSFIHRNGRTARMEASGTAILIQGPDEKLPAYINEDVELIHLPEVLEIPEKPKWSTLFLAAGKKDKVNKIDIVGFFTQKGQLKKEDIGLIEVKDYFSFVAIRKVKVNNTLHLIKDERIKNKKVKIEIAK